MTDLDRKEIYYLCDLNDQQEEELLRWLKRNDKGWAVSNLRVDKRYKCIKFKGEWFYSSDKHTKNALELFQESKENTDNTENNTYSPQKEKIETLKYLLKKDIILTPKQYKKLWKK